MTGRFASAIVGALLLGSVDLIGQQSLRREPQKPLPPGNRIEVRDGDTVVVEDDARVRVVRRRSANIRTVFSPTERWLVVLVDFATNAGGPDGRVDRNYSYTGLTGDWPMGERWEGLAAIEEYSIAGEGGPIRMGLVGPRGLVQFLPLHASDDFRDTNAAAVLSFMGFGGGASSRVSFDDAERIQIEQTRQNAARQTAGPPRISTGIVAGFSTSAGGVVIEPGTSTMAGGPVRVGGNIASPTKLVDVPPVIPEVAQRAGIKGVVILEVTVDTDGSVKDARVLRSIPLLDEAALAAVRQWRYMPTMLGGQAVPVIMTVTVAFN